MIDAEGKTKNFLVNVFLMIAFRVVDVDDDSGELAECNVVRKLASEVMPNLFLIQFQKTDL